MHLCAYLTCCAYNLQSSILMIFYILYGMLMRGTVRMDRMVLLNLLLLVLRSAQSGKQFNVYL